MIIVVMGVTGTGKTTVGKLLAKQLDWSFFDGDDYHPQENIEKMKAGIPLTDEDRAPWLRTLAGLLDELVDRDQSAVVACSALKADYRDTLRVGEHVRFVHLCGSTELLKDRLEAREGHIMPAALLPSQLDDLEAPGPDALQVSVDRPPAEIVDAIRSELAL